MRAPARAITTDPLDQHRKLKELLDMGANTEDEYKQKKVKLRGMI